VLPYFPFQGDTFKMAMGVQTGAHLIEIDEEHYQRELALKHELLADTPHDYFQALPDTESLQWAVVALLLPDMAAHYPQYFTLTQDGKRWTWHNHFLNTETQFVFGEQNGLPQEPLDWVGRQVQEDLLILQNTTDGRMPLVAGQLCFPNAWCLDDKMQQSFMAIHGDVPLFAEQLGRSSSLLLQRLKAGRPVWRLNWSLKTTARLNQIPRFRAEEEQSAREITHENIGARCLLRIERQGLVHLPGAVLFTIHTYQAPLIEVVTTPETARRMYTVIKTMPPAMVRYKAMSPFRDVLLDYLATRYQC